MIIIKKRVHPYVLNIIKRKPPIHNWTQVKNVDNFKYPNWHKFNFWIELKESELDRLRTFFVKKIKN